MRKSVLIQVAIITAVSIVIIPLIFLETKGTAPQTIKGVTQQNGQFLSLDLLSGQTVKGSCVINYDAKLINFFVIDPNGKATRVKPIYPDNTGWASFSFTAPIDGQYDIRVNLYHEIWTYINYTYEITPQRVFGLTPIVIIGMAIAFGATVELVIIVMRVREKRAKLQKAGKTIL